MSTSPNEPSKLGGNTEVRRIMKGAAAAALAAFNPSCTTTSPPGAGTSLPGEEPQLFSEQLRAPFRSLRKPEIRGSARRPLLVHVES
jgi:hypothetical protein